MAEPLITADDVIRAGACVSGVGEVVRRLGTKLPAAVPVSVLLPMLNQEECGYVQRAAKLDGDGYGDGYGDGSGYGYGDGSGYGYGYGDGYGDGYGYGYGDGSGYGDGDGSGYGSGSGYGDGSGYGRAYA